MIRFLHTADWQIGTQFGQFEPDEAAHLAEARFETVRRIAEEAAARKVDAVLVAGDVFDLQTVSDTVIRRLFGALQAFAAYADTKVTHLKPHGALNNMAADDADYAMAIGRAIKTVDKDIIYVALYGSQMQKAAEKLGLRLAREGFVDRKYDDDGNLASRSIPGTVLKDPKAAIENTLRMVQENEVVAMSGKRVKVNIDTFCVHGDEATGVAVAGAVRKALEAADVKIVPLPEMKL